jgi:hypothetical protein
MSSSLARENLICEKGLRKNKKPADSLSAGFQSYDCAD